MSCRQACATPTACGRCHREDLSRARNAPHDESVCRRAHSTGSRSVRTLGPRRSAEAGEAATNPSRRVGDFEGVHEHFELKAVCFGDDAGHLHDIEAVPDRFVVVELVIGVPVATVTGYSDLVRAVKARVPSLHVHAFSPMEIVNGASRGGQSIRDWLLELRAARLDTIPGTAAEILDDEVLWILTKGKLPTAAWVEVVTTAHQVGLRSSSTMMYGHVDNPKHWVGHLRVLRGIQDETGGFTEFVPLPFVHQSSPLYLAGAARPGPTIRDNRAVHALARIMLHGRVSNIQTSWVKLGTTGTQMMLQGGANDLGGTLMEEAISRMAGSQHGSARSVAELRAIADGIGRSAHQRTTDYATCKQNWQLPM